MRHHRPGHTAGHRRGAAAVELAVLLPFLALLFVLSIDFGRLFYFSLTLNNCARNGALYACDPVLNPENPYHSVQEAALADAGNFQPPPTVTSTTGSDHVDVTVTWEFQTITKFPGVPDKMTLERTVRMKTLPVLPSFN